MKRKSFVLIWMLFAIISLKAQISEGGIPKSFELSDLKSTSNINHYNTPRLNVEKLLNEDKKNGLPLRYAKFHSVNINIKKVGSELTIDEGTIWRYRIKSEEAYSIGLQFKEYKLPENASLFIYNQSRNNIYGAFTSKNNKESGLLSIAEFPGNEVIIEYFEPRNVKFDGVLIIGKIGQAYRNIYSTVESTTDDSFIDINCPEGDKVQLEKHAVAKMTWEEDGIGYLCTGSLINNVRNDGTPYFLTAHHCLSNNIASQTLITYFNYEKEDCNGSTIAGKTLSGSSLKATYYASDFTLLLLDNTPPANYQPYYPGWDAGEDSLVIGGTGIHHPSGLPKKVSIEQNQIFSYEWELNWEDVNTSPPHSHWILEFDSGITEGGSSGSPLFNSKKQIIGQLHGGADEFDFYGKISASWINGTYNFQRLKPWLDPDNTGVLKIDGYTPANNSLDAHFYSDFQTVCADEPLLLNDGSLFSPTSWEWSFEPSGVEYVNETNANSQNPEVIFNEEGSYTITLKVKNDVYANQVTRENYIVTGNNLDLSITSVYEPELCTEDLMEYSYYATGADSFSWSVINGDSFILIDSSSLLTDTLYFSINDTVAIDSSFTIDIQLTGFHGECKDSIEESLSVVFPFNDNIENAYMLSLGKSGPYTNQCAGTQENEPNPPQGSCNTQETWCECEVSDTILENSVWFTFLGPETGIVAIDAPGFDDQIAVYEAESAEDILSGNESNYKIIGANDDYFGEDMDYSALIEKIVVEPGKMYWLQVDGSACGASGTFYLELFDYSLEKQTGFTTQDISASLRVFPNPATDYITIKGNFTSTNAQFSLLTVDGKIVFSTELYDLIDSEQFKVCLPDNLNSGMYILFVSGDKINYQQSLSIIK